MFTVLVLMMMVAIALSVMGREGREIAHPIIRRTMAHARLAHHHAPIRFRVLVVVVALALAALALALLMDYRVLVPVDETQPSGSQASGPGPGWRVDQGLTLPPSGFSGRTLVRFQKGASASGLVVIAHGQFKRLGWRITGRDAAYCFLDVELIANPKQRQTEQDGYATPTMVLDEGWHEANVHAWCPQGHADAQFGIATLDVDANGHRRNGASWTEAGEADIRHR